MLSSAKAIDKCCLLGAAAQQAKRGAHDGNPGRLAQRNVGPHYSVVIGNDREARNTVMISTAPVLNR